MIKGHITEHNNKINGNRMEAIIDIYALETREERIQFFETYDFEPCDIMALMDSYGVDFKVSYHTESFYEDISFCEIETNELIFVFQDNQFMRVLRKFNILDDLREKYNLPY